MKLAFWLAANSHPEVVEVVAVHCHTESILWFGLGAVVALFAVGCGVETSHPDELHAAYLQTAEQTSQTGQPAASVDGRPISSDLLGRIWRESPDRSAASVMETAVRREAAAGTMLDDVERIDQELLGFARKRGMVRRLLIQEVESQVTPKDIEDAAIKDRMERLKSRVGQPEGLEVSHLLVKLDEKQAGDRAKSVIEQIRGRLADGERVDVEDLYRVKRAVETDLSLVVNAHLRFRTPGAPKWKKPPGWVEVVEPFRKAAAELAADEGLGQVSEPVKTQFGWHIIVVERRLPRKVPAAEPLRNLAVHQLVTERRRKRYKQKISQWMDQTTYETYPSALRTEPAGAGSRQTE